MHERAKPRETHILMGGDFTRPGAPASPGTPGCFRAPSPASRPKRRPGSTWRAGWLTADNPLTARVLVNRFWGHYFGLGLVETENDFGTQGTPPSHPELLDWLATEFMVREGWWLKACTG